ncbi:protease modulator HflC [Pelagibaculum spongiae]|uniref:Protein HflC n=1 Tax=Pelagibaculum spongiae TaxID=2080658 RepID=A0A2V1H1U1_9GAMM|nr:protease modulator HflC [Pelagibaculum spongiae]PVZ70412.1 protease modulator HflC [Pelagibaculum spongiae]
MTRSSSGILAILGLIGLVIYGSVFVVSEKQRAMVLFLGQISQSNVQPGIHFKWPIVNEVRTFERRIITLDAPPASFLTAEKKAVEVDSFVEWKISPSEGALLNYFTTTRGDELQAARLLTDIINKDLRDEFARRTLQEVISEDRSEIMRLMVAAANAKVLELGIEVVDVRIKRIELPSKVTESVYRRMRTERNRIAREFRSNGEKDAEIIRAQADRQRTEIAATAYRDSEIIRGNGDATATTIYADAYSQDREFYGFVRSLQAYQLSLNSKQDTLILKPDSEFFRYFNKQAK